MTARRPLIHISLLAALTLASGCSTKVLVAPDRGLHQTYSRLDGSAVSDSQKLGAKYLKAKNLLSNKEFDKACDYFEDLADDKRFALQKLAFINELKTCDYSASKLEDIWEDERDDQTVPKWLREEYIRTSFSLAKEKDVKEYEAHFAYRLSYFEKVQKERIALLRNAIAIAHKEELEDEKLKYEKRLYKVAPRYVKEINKDNIYKVARDFERSRQFKKARTLYRRIIKSGEHEFKDVKNAYNRIRMSYKNERKLEVFVLKTFEMTRFLKKKLKSDPKNEEYRDAWANSVITLSRAVWTRHDRPQAHTILKRLYRAMKRGEINNQKQLATMYWLFGAMAMEAGKRNRAIANYKQALKFKKIDKKLKNKLLWSIPHNYYLKRHYKTASNLFLANIKKTDDEGFQKKFKFWAAKSLMKVKKNKQARDLLFDLAENDEFGYYGIIAHKELKLAFKPFKKDQIEDTSFHNTFEWLIALDEKEIAQSYLDYKRPTFKKASQKWAALNLYKVAGYNDGMIKLYFNLPEDQRKELLKLNPSYAFPVPFSKLVKKAQKKYKVSKNLIYAISRQESAFNPHARSWADAFGLMQLLPERAQTLKTKFKIPYRTPEDLFEPEVNIPFGASLLKNLKSRFKHFPLYVASYNASDKAVTRWHNERFKGDYVEFIEKIPYAETQKYVKLVLRNYFIYKRIHSNKKFYFNDKFFKM